jgi:hypothetical protein
LGVGEWGDAYKGRIELVVGDVDATRDKVRVNGRVLENLVIVKAKAVV